MQQKFICSQFWELDVQDQSSISVVFSAVSLLRDGHLLVTSHGLASVLVCVLISSSYKDTQHIGLGSTRLVLF